MIRQGMNELEAMLALNACQLFDNALHERWMEGGFSPASFIAAGRKLWAEFQLSEKKCTKLEQLLAREWTKKELDVCQKHSVKLLSFYDEAYPESLKDLQDPPLVLYMWGRYTPVSQSVGVVGTRRCSPYGKRVATTLGEQCAKGGWEVISGGARGIDGASHAGCLNAGGRTFAVLGTGVDVVFPSEHVALFEGIRGQGALISEYPLGTLGRAWHFPQRNRIIAALAARLVVVEAPHKSGAMITAKQALELGREIWAAPGRMEEDICAGSNQLIFDGAYPLINYDVFGIRSGKQRSLFNAESVEEGGLLDGIEDPVDRHLLQFLAQQGDRTVDNLATELRMSAAEVTKRLVLLAARGRVFNSSPGRYSASANR